MCVFYGVLLMNTLEKMETFIVLAECGSFTESAKRLFCSQPTISHHIQQLEELFESPLVQRSGKQVQLTRQGEILLRYAKQISHLVEEAAVELKRISEQERVLSVYVSNYIAGYFFSDILNEFHTILPHKPLEINTYCYSDLIRCFQEGRTHYALMPIYPEDDYIRKNFETSVLFEEELLLILPVDHPLAKRRLLYARDLHNETVLLPKSEYLQQYVINHLSSRQVKTRFLQMSNFETIKQAVKSRHGIAFLPSGAVKEELKRGELVNVPVSSLQIRRQNGFVFRKNAELSQADRAFCQNVEQYLRTV
ncbi:LysR family transcriptional regulator [Brevibacillus agri]|uniref:LysR family transcriptional regulator n=2 Tax=Brevibacillus agri TaxID=51101 RepID=A0A3M8AUA1_9BACL|nr:LysR family transcriptional regulator [Brevibacillus agri]RNB54227.1 LysR family transcriptional regulator [Brevibacillus agri]